MINQPLPLLLEMVADADDEKVDIVRGINVGWAIELKLGMVEFPLPKHRHVIKKPVAKACFNVQAQATAGNGQRFSPKFSMISY